MHLKTHPLAPTPNVVCHVQIWQTVLQKSAKHLVVLSYEADFEALKEIFNTISVAQAQVCTAMQAELVGVAALTCTCDMWFALHPMHVPVGF